MREELQIPAKGRLAIYVGRLAVYKGISTLLYALGPVFEQYDLYLLYIGSPDFNVAGTRETLQQMKEQVAKNRWGTGLNSWDIGAIYLALWLPLTSLFIPLLWRDSV